MNQAIEAGISGFASIIGLAIIFVIGWFAYKAFNFLFDSSKPEPRPTVEPEPKRTTGIVERPFSTDPDTPIGVSEGSSVEQAQFAKPISQSHDRSQAKNKKIAVAILVFVLIFVPTKFCPTSGHDCLTSGWDFIFKFGSYDRVDMERMIIQLVIAGLICWLLVRKKS